MATGWVSIAPLSHPQASTEYLLRIRQHGLKDERCTQDPLRGTEDMICINACDIRKEIEFYWKNKSNLPNVSISSVLQQKEIKLKIYLKCLQSYIDFLYMF